MRKAMWLVALVPLFPLPAIGQEQELPLVEVFGGYSYERADITRVDRNLNGWNAEISQNLNNWFGGVASFTGFYAKPGGIRVNVHSFMYGPLFTYRKSKAFTPFAHALFGAVRASRGFLGISQADTDFGFAAGGGLDVRIKDSLAIRVIQADYLVTPFLGLRQDNFRLSAGIVLRLGKKH